MLYYLIFLNKGIVVSISRFDDEEARDRVYSYCKNQCSLGGMADYDEIQVFNEVD